MENDGLNHIMSWQASGRSFKIHNQQLLEKEILQKWFCQTRFASFQRQLNIYGFVRISSGADKGGYYHSMFLRDRPELASQIPREKVNKPDAKPRAAAPRASGVEDSNMANQGQETSQMGSQAFPMLANAPFLSSNLSAMVSGSQVSTNHSPSLDATGNVDFLSSLLFPRNDNTAFSSLCASRIGQDLLSLLSLLAPPLPNSVPSNVSQLLPTGPLQNSGPETAALLELLLRSEGTGTNTNGTSITSAAADHYRNLLNARWQQNRPPEDRR